MLFNSYIFILVFLPLSIIGYFLFNNFEAYRLGKLYLIGMSLWFYAYFNLNYLPLILLSVGVNYLLYIWMEKRRKIALGLGVLLNIGLLFYFKYFDFFLENINILFGRDYNLLHLLLPLGISFFTFQQVGFLIDAYRGEALGYSFEDYALFVTFFPQLIAGPIVSHDEMIPQFQNKELKAFDYDNASRGIYRFSLGLAKKVLLADVFGRGVAYGFANLEGLSALATIIMMMSYMLQLYFDFSGYCDMASGAALMMNIRIADNFLSPHKAVSIPDFWKRWHITLSRFLTRYVYIPLGGSRRGTVRTYLNIFLIFVLSGMWHGAGWTFLVWGLLHGLCMCVSRAVSTSIGKHFDFAKNSKIFRGLMIAFTIALTLCLLAVFRAESLSQAGLIFSNVFGNITREGTFSLASVPMAMLKEYQIPEFFYILKVLHLNADTQIPLVSAIGLIGAGMGIVLLAPNTVELTGRFKPTFLKSLVVTVLIIWCLVSLSQVSTFLYFDF